MKILRIISRLIVGSTFIFSGVVKAIDPLGSAYKFHDYFQAFNIGFLNALSLPLAIILCTAEFIAGVSVITGFRQRTGIIGVMILLIIFTPITFLLALTNPVSDCGCFGDAIHLTNWQTFGKNVILLALAIILLFDTRNSKQQFGVFKEWIIISVAIVLFIFFSIYNLIFLPIIDFLPYKSGVKIAEKMFVPEGLSADQYESTFIYEKNGIKKEFSLNNYPANDTTWIFVEQKSVLVKKGYQPPIHDFIITSMTGEDITQKVLSNTGYSLLMISKKLPEANKKSLEQGFDLGRNCTKKGIDFYVLTSSGSTDMKNYINGLEFCSVDETTLKTIVRSNPGYILLKDGRIIKKWSWASLPSKDWFNKQFILTE
jgi:hypothetical protein